MNTLWTFGDSYTAEYYPVGFSPPNFYDKYKEFLGGWLPQVWPTQLSKLLNFNLENKGWGASSNYSIFYKFCLNIEHFKENDIVIFQWASPYRFLLANEEVDQLQDVVPSASYDFIDQKIVDKILVNRASNVWLNEIIYWSLIIDEICRLKKVNLFYWSFSEEIISYLKSNYKNYNKNKYILSKVDHRLYNTLCELSNNMASIIQETNGLLEDGHFGQYGHQTQAEYFYKFINRRI